MNKNKNKFRYNDSVQYYRGIPIRLIVYTEEHFARLRAKRFLILGNSDRYQNIWIPNSFLKDDGTLIDGCNLDWLFTKPINIHKLELSGIPVDVKSW